ncbi:hypothetical protein ACFWTC_37705 [Streptomyces sp. NPDC058619]|uniref:hypothetical protein n=1 Tax=unclassified Streptomyces TaxID=2593676 RepID=UPI00365FC2F1
MSPPTNDPEPSRRDLPPPGYGAPSPELLVRAERGLARFLGDQDDRRDATTDGGER